MTHLLDTTAVSALIRREPGFVSRYGVYQHGPHVVICPITRGELLYGVSRMPDGRRKDSLQLNLLNHLAEIPCVPIPPAAGEHYAQLRLEADTHGAPMGENDLWIAATAMALDATLVTTDDDFGQCLGLRVEDWTK